MSYVNDQSILAPENMLEANAGLAGLGHRHRPGQPRLHRSAARSFCRTYQVPLKVADNYADNPVQHRRHGGPEPEPAVRAAVLHRHPARFQGHGGRSALRGQSRGGRLSRLRLQPGAVINQNGFLADFLRAQKQRLPRAGRTATASTRHYNAEHSGQPAAHASSASWPGRAHRRATRMFYLQTGEVGELATYYQTNGYNGNAVHVLPESERAGHGHAHELLQLQLQLAATGGAAPHEIGHLLRGQLHLVAKC